ncbi:MAG: beta-N-acetylhexosaminidase [Desulfobacteraceae bacterium]|nr:beta-N-acetylhexosaminidase [Desulfobacteraceae bacterium]
MAGQRIMAGFTGTTLNADLRYLIDTICVGGIILFSRNIENAGQVQRLCADAQAYAASCGNPPLFIAVDQEGGTVARLKPPDFTELPAAARMCNASEAAEFAGIAAFELSRAGINMNMAPVLDVADPDGNSVMTGRAYGDDPATVAEMGTAVISGLQKNRIMAVAKHFPGIGRTFTDSHADRPDLELSAEELETRDLLPFSAAVRNHAAGIMLSHVRYGAFDKRWPASLSPAVARDLLRRKMEYSGLVLTDDLEMGAIARYYEMPEVACQILDADIDIALICHTLAKVEAAFETICAQYAGMKSRRRLGQPVARILSTKERYLGQA